MNVYKVFRRIDNGIETITSKKLKEESKKDYYKLLKEEVERGNKQLILTKDIISSVMMDYILSEKYSLISINTDSSKANEKLAEYIGKAREDRAYFAKVVIELSKDSYLDINDITLQKYDEIISLYSHGVVSTNTLLDEKLLKAIEKGYLGYVS